VAAPVRIINDSHTIELGDVRGRRLGAVVRSLGINGPAGNGIWFVRHEPETLIVGEGAGEQRLELPKEQVPVAAFVAPVALWWLARRLLRRRQ
jgi:hypothetical protein